MRLAFILGLIAFLAACAQAAVATPRPTAITIAGATGMRPVLQALTDAFNRQHPNVLFVLHGGGSRLGEQQTVEGRADLGATTLMPSSGIPLTSSFATPARNLVRIPIGIDGLAIVVHVSNHVETLTMQQLQDLYSGRTLDRKDAGGPGGDVVLISREDGSGARSLFEERVMGDKAVSLTAVVMPSSADVIEYSAKTPLAIGYVSRAYVIDQIQPADENTVPKTPAPQMGGRATAAANSVNVVPLDGLLPTDDNLHSQTYPLIEPLYLVSRGEPSGWVRQFVDFVLSPAGQTIVEHYHLRVR